MLIEDVSFMVLKNIDHIDGALDFFHFLDHFDHTSKPGVDLLKHRQSLHLGSKDVQELLKRFFVIISVNIPIAGDLMNCIDELRGMIRPEGREESEIALKHLTIKYFKLAHVFEIPIRGESWDALTIICCIYFRLSLDWLKLYDCVRSDLLLLRTSQLYYLIIIVINRMIPNLLIRLVIISLGILLILLLLFVGCQKGKHLNFYYCPRIIINRKSLHYKVRIV